MSDSLSFAKPIISICTFVIILSIAVLNFPEHFLLFLILAVISASLSFVFFFVSGSKAAAILAALIIVLGAVCPYRAYVSNEKYAQSVLELLGDSEHTFSGTVLHSYSSQKPANVRIKVLQIDGRNLIKPFYVQATSFSGDSPEKGDTLLFKGKPSSVDSSDYTEFDTAAYLQSKKVFIRVYGAEFISNRKNVSPDLLSALRLKYENAVYTYVKDGYNYKAASIVKALTLADKTDFSKSMSETFAKSGLSHLMCVSGLHLCVLLGMIATLLKGITLHKNIRCGLLIGFCLFYISFTGASPSVIRAGIMACFTYTASITGRKNNSFIALFGSGAIMTVCNPYVVLDISARLSFVSTLGVILMWNVSDSIPQTLRLKSKFASGIMRSVLVNIGAVAITLPLGADIFGGFSTVSIPATLATSYACEILIVLSNILCVLSFIPVLNLLCPALGSMCTKLSLYISDTAEWFASYKYSYVEADNTGIMLIASAFFIALLSFLISFGASKAVRVTLVGVVILSLVMCITGVVNAVKYDKELCVSYYRKNKDDRQLSVKLGRNGYLIFNADDVLCMNINKTRFDELSGKNHIVLLPNDNTDPYVLSENIRSFSSRYGIKGVLVPDSRDGLLLSEKLSAFGIECHIFPDKFQLDEFGVEFSYDAPNSYSLCVNDGKEEVFAVFSDKYSNELFDGHNGICAYFTSETDTQFKPETDKVPDCKIFFTRTDKEFRQDGIFNTFGKTSFDLKER